MTFSFRNQFAENIFQQKYAHEGCETWPELCEVLVNEVCRHRLSHTECDQLIQYMTDMKFIPGGRYLYYAGREMKAYNNCYLLRSEEDSREDWAMTSWKIERCLTTGGGIGNDYSIYRPRNSVLRRTGGIASGPVPKMEMGNEMGRFIVQGGSRRSALYASLRHSHPDIHEFLAIKDWDAQPIEGTDLTIGELKRKNFNFRAPLDMTNISVNYDTAWLTDYWETGDVGDIFRANVMQALRTAEPGFSFNFFDKENETLRNACTEVTSEDDSDVCNLGSLNLARIESLVEAKQIIELATKFLICGSIVSELPYDKIKEVRVKNRRIGLGLMGVHEWLLRRGYNYEVTEEFEKWLSLYEKESTRTARNFAYDIGVSHPVAVRAVAPTGSIGILAGTTTGIEPLFSVAYRRRYLKAGSRWHYQYIVDSTAKTIIEELGTSPQEIQTSLSLAKEPERRIKFQAKVQRYVDMGISSTINLPQWGTTHNNEDTAVDFCNVLARYAHNLRGFTCYPDGARGGQPLTEVEFQLANGNEGREFEEQTHDICDITNHGGVCNV